MLKKLAWTTKTAFSASLFITVSLSLSPNITTMKSSQQPLQIILKSELGHPTRAITLHDPTQPWAHLIHSLFPTHPCGPTLFLSLNGKPLPPTSLPLHTPSLRPLSTLTLHSRLLGGGGDGGATGAESRDCYLNMYAEKKPDKVDPNEQRLSKWTTCALSSEPLTPPCVVDRLGNLFNKEPLVRALIARSLPSAFRHIKGLKDLIPIHLSDMDDRFQCPVSGLEFNGKYRFFVLEKCGHVLSAKAIKEVKSSSCLVCHKEVEAADMIPINGSEDEVAALRERMELLSQNRVKSKKSKKRHAVELETPKGKAADAVANGAPAVKGTDANSKRFKAVDIAPANANKEVFASIFTSSRKSDFKETYSCRSLPLGRN